jgi:uncharacterized membrane protein
MRPLDTSFATIGVTVFLTILGAFYAVRATSFTIPLTPVASFIFSQNGFMVTIPLIAVLLSASGALHLNAGGSGLLTFWTLLLISGSMVMLIRRASVLHPNVIPIALYCISLSLLFMTSLRGEFIIGHDIQREFAVFQITKHYGLWAMEHYRDAYNACLSITLLPTLISNLLSFNDVFVFKVLAQSLFALAPVVLYMLARTYMSAMLAFCTALLFISFPTFFTDMPFLVRQEIAFLFLALLLHTLFAEQTERTSTRILAILFATGIVLSHYTTTYTVIVVFMCTILARAVFVRMSPLLAQFSVFHTSAIREFSEPSTPPQKHITVSLILIMLFLSVLWSSVITNTSSNSLERVIRNTAAAFNVLNWENMRSGDLRLMVFGKGKAYDQPEDLFERYVETVIVPARASAPPETYYDETLYSRYSFNLVDRDIVPYTRIGSWLLAVGTDVAEMQITVRQTFAKLIQAFIVIGFIAILFSNRLFTQRVPGELILLAAANFFMVASIVVLPVLSIEYGVLRAFQQALMLLALTIIAGVLGFFFLFPEHIRKHALVAFILCYFLTGTGVLTQLVGGYEPSLQLNNDGLYYDFYYLRNVEVAGMKWLAGEVERTGDDVQSEAQIDPTVFTTMDSIIDANERNSIHPGLVRQDSYVFLNYKNAHERQATFVYNDHYITYEYPVEFLDSVKDAVYDNGFVKIYR